MADAFYEEFRNGMFGGGVHNQPDLTTNDIRVGLRDTGTTALNLATQIDVADVRSALQGTDTALVNLEVGVSGVGAFNHDDETYPSLSSGLNTVELLDYFDFQTAVDATSPMIAAIDSWTGLPFTPNDGDVILAPAAGGVFQIT